MRNHAHREKEKKADGLLHSNIEIIYILVGIGAASPMRSTVNISNNATGTRIYKHLLGRGWVLSLLKL